MDAAGAGGNRLLLRRRVAHVLEPGNRERETLHAVYARDAHAAKMSKRFRWIAAGIEPAGEDIRVLEPLAGALAGVGQHGMRRIANELNAATAPVLRQGTGEQAPFRALGDDAQK